MSGRKTKCFKSRGSVDKRDGIHILRNYWLFI